MALPLSQDKSLLHIKTSRQPGYKTDISVTLHFCGFVRLTSLFFCPFLLLFANGAFWFPKEELRDLKGVILYEGGDSGSRSSQRATTVSTAQACECCNDRPGSKVMAAPQLQLFSFSCKFNKAMCPHYVRAPQCTQAFVSVLRNTSTEIESRIRLWLA